MDMAHDIAHDMATESGAHFTGMVNESWAPPES